MLGQFSAIEIFGDRLVQAWLAGQDDGAAAGLNGLRDRLKDSEIVAEIDRPERRQDSTDASQPTLDRGTGARSLFKVPKTLEGNGGRDKDRTCDPYDVNVVLSR